MSPISRRLAVAAAAFILVPAFALAHGPSRQKVTEKIEIDAPPAKVWSIVGNFQDINWLPGVEKTEGTGGNTPDKAKRKLTMKNGTTIEETLTRYDAAGMSLSYKIDQVDLKTLPVNNYSSTITVKPLDGGKSEVEWKGAFYRGFMNNDPPPELSDEAAVKGVTDIYKSGLASLKAKAEAK